MGDLVADPARGTGLEQAPGSAPQGNGGTSLSVITEGVGELAVIDPEVAKKACEEVLEKVKLMHGISSDSLTKPANGSEAERTPRAAGDLANGDIGEGCEIKCLDDPPGAASKIQEEDETTANTEDETTANTVKTARKRQKNNSAKQSWLLRLFESKLFDISMAISYLYNSKEPGVQAYIGNRLFCFRNEEVAFYLPQLLNMYIHMDEDVGDAIKPYIVHRCRQSINFSLQCALLLGAYSSDMHISTQRHSRGTKLRKLILSDELKPAHKKRELPSLSPAPEMGLSPSKRTHQRSKSDATVTISLSSNLKRTASNPKVESEEESPRQVPRCLRQELVLQWCRESVMLGRNVMESGRAAGETLSEWKLAGYGFWKTFLEDEIPQPG
ncbi:PREDICTED: phosphatidylinositol 4-kinase beta-like, partial [Chlamydotis macqueenii]|uniref:phosphatidylinositol 4-kinase beta-like n=1 Tax=Chlamydotis macqueenii TaxID=187382 RepID=UPI000529CD0D